MEGCHASHQPSDASTPNYSDRRPFIFRSLSTCAGDNSVVRKSSAAHSLPQLDDDIRSAGQPRRKLHDDHDRELLHRPSKRRRWFILSVLFSRERGGERETDRETERTASELILEWGVGEARPKGPRAGRLGS